MSSNRSRRTAVAALVAAVLIGGGLTAITPAGAEVADAVATNWKKVWKKKLRPHTDKRYYKKSQSDAKYSTKTETAAGLGNYWTKAQSDASYAPKTQSYTKAESDAKYAPYPALLKGAYFMTGYANAAGSPVGDNVSFGYTMSANPIPHYINAGSPPPAGCSGTPEAPDASPGHLCVFEQLVNNATQRTVASVSGIPGQTSRMGVIVYGEATAAGSVFVYGSWAMRPLSVSATGSKASTPPKGSEDRIGD